MANEFVARNGIFAQNNSQITGSAIISGSLQVIGNISQHNSSSYIGNLAGAGATAASYSVYLGEQAGFNSSYSANSTLVGSFAGFGAYSSSFVTAIGYSAGISMSNAGNSTAVGPFAGYAAHNAIGSAFLGIYAGAGAVSSSYSTFIGPYAGYLLSGSSYTITLGYNAGFNSTLGNNNILIGTNVTLPSGSSNSINIGGLIFGSGSYFSTSSASPSASNGYIGINQPNPQFNLDVSGSARITSNTQITGSLNVSGSITTTGTITAQTLIVQTITSSVEYSSGSNVFGNSLANTQTFTGSVNITGSSHTIIGSSSFNGNMVITGSITATAGGFDSDLTLKNIVSRDLSLYNIANEVSPIIYTWKDETKGTTPRFGYGAQEIQPLIPEAVYQNGSTLAVDYTQVHTVLIDENTKRIQELEKQVTELKRLINELGSTIK